MKKLILSLVAIATLSLSAFGQAPEGFKYQAVVRNEGNTILSNQAVGMRMTIQKGAIGGTTVYQETFTPTTNAYGLVNLEIGNGTVVSGTFATIDWANGPYFIETAVDVTGGTSYSVIGTSQLMSVPYALHAKSAGVVTNMTVRKEILISPQELVNSSSVMYPPGYPRQVIVCPGDNSTLSGNTQIDIPIPSDWDGTDMNAEIFYSANGTGNLNLSLTVNAFAVGEADYTSTWAGQCETVSAAYTLHKASKKIYGSTFDPNDELMTIQFNRYDSDYAGNPCPDTIIGDVYIHGLRITYNAKL